MKNLASAVREGSFIEGLLLPSVETILHKKFGVTDFYMRLKTKCGSDLQELDGFGFVNGKKREFGIIDSCNSPYTASSETA